MHPLPDCTSLSGSDLERRLFLCVDFSRRRLRGFDVGHGCPSIYFAATLDGVPVRLRVSFEAESTLEAHGAHRVTGSCALLVSDPLDATDTFWCSVEQPFDFLVVPSASAAACAPCAHSLYLQAVASARIALESHGPFQAQFEAGALGSFTPEAAVDLPRRL